MKNAIKLVIAVLVAVIVTVPLEAQTTPTGTRITWTQVADSTFTRDRGPYNRDDSTIRTVAYGTGVYVAGGHEAKLAYSTDNGVTWTQVGNHPIMTDSTYIDRNSSSPVNVIIHDGSKFIAAGWRRDNWGTGRVVTVRGSSTVMSSVNGRTWTNMQWADWQNTESLQGIAHGEGKYVIVGNDVNGRMHFGIGDIGRNIDGNWNGRGWGTTPTVPPLSDVAYGGGKFIIVGQGGTILPITNITRPPDSGRSYAITSTAITGANPFGTSAILAITYGNGRFVAVGEGGRSAYSADGLRWTASSNNAFGTNNINAVTYGGGLFLAVGDNGRMAYSSDGASWTQVADSSFGSTAVNGVTWGNGRFVAVGNDGKIAYSNQLEPAVTIPQTQAPTPAPTPSPRPSRDAGRPEEPAPSPSRR